MTDQSAQEPTMEEILASIRRIISEDDAPAEAPAGEEPAPAAELEPEPEPAPSPALMDETPSVQPEEEVLELTERAEPEQIGDLDVAEAQPFPAAEAEPEPAPQPAAAASPYDSLVGDSAAASAASAFAGLAATFQKPEAPAARGPDLNFASGSTVEAMVAEMLRPMLKDWLDANLPGIVEAQVRKEVERIARNAG
ncbi:DUF2497 domain-containing protein [Brevundimonas sp. S30B]|uniref:DUF2497 domain-containing protein n=1 Tax=unclassified Brevundimonas TaxID=2622653 RepID=UPI00107286F5|nr:MULTISPECIES: DUF2497 domain-containing protein [unclassified Brevundimonas]QBX37891.1 DUF2497 domain-containing protein [Brevundimonas sp. MF30-B]TFW02753.1 DUF2497 domain-containing protein [Brevundimonas sp. S30B]